MIPAEHLDLAGRALAIALEDLDRRRLAGTVRPEEGDDLAARDVEVDPPDCLVARVGLPQAAYADRRVGIERSRGARSLGCRSRSSGKARRLLRPASTTFVAPAAPALDQPVDDQRVTILSSGLPAGATLGDQPI